MNTKNLSKNYLCLKNKKVNRSKKLIKIISDELIKEVSDFLTSDEINGYLTTTFVGKKIIHFDSIDSTNSYAKMIGQTCDDGTVVICEHQTSGRGRLGRQWESQYNSMCMSIILKPKISVSHVAKITQVCAAAVALSLEEFRIDAQIKWPNDLMVNNKKICGILTEMVSENNKVNYVVVGIGMNINNSYGDFPDDIKNIATSIKIETGNEIKRSIMSAKIINNFELLYNEFVKNNFSKSLDICRNKSNVLGRNINLIKNNEITIAKAIALGDDGELIVQYENGQKDSIISGEISVRTID